MKKLFSFLSILMLFSSCATLLNKPVVRINLYSEKPTRIQVNNQNYQLDHEEVITVERKRDTLLIIAESDSIRREIKLKPKNSFFYYANIYYYGIGFIWDYKSPKRYTYQKNVFLNYHDFTNPPEKFFPSRKGQFNFVFSLPWINNFYFHPQNELVRQNTGFWGGAVGLDYYYKERKFVNLSANAVADILVPVPAPVDYMGEYSLMSSEYVSVTDNYQFHQFSLGYGLNYSRNTWDLINSMKYYALNHSPGRISKSNQSIGLTINEYYRFGKHFYTGLVYRPSIFSVYPVKEFRYEHLISIDFAWKWNLKK